MAGESAREVAARSRAKAERLVRHAELFERGAEGEAQTASVLSSLPRDWAAIHDVRWPGRRFANIDHIVLGPPGIFVVDSKNWSGRVVIDGPTLRQNGRSRESAVPTCADSALALAEVLGPFARHVSPVLCFVRDEPLTGWVREVMVCSTANVAQILLTRPSVMEPEQRAEAWTRLNLELESALFSPSPRHESASRRSRSVQRTAEARPSSSSATRQRRRSSGASLGRFLVGVAMMLGLVLFGPQVASAIGGLVATYITETALDSGVDDRGDPLQPGIEKDRKSGSADGKER